MSDLALDKQRPRDSRLVHDDESSLDAPDVVGVATVRARTGFLSQLAGVVAVAGPPIGILSAMGVLWGVAFSTLDLVLLLVLYVLSGLGITAGWHRYFSHRSFETSRPMQAVL
ncbi:MAG: hypothetical protein ACR2OD_05980, partial [Gaiellaceae bacterium]